MRDKTKQNSVHSELCTVPVAAAVEIGFQFKDFILKEERKIKGSNIQG